MWYLIFFLEYSNNIFIEIKMWRILTVHTFESMIFLTKNSIAFPITRVRSKSVVLNHDETKPTAIFFENGQMPTPTNLRNQTIWGSGDPVSSRIRGLVYFQKSWLWSLQFPHTVRHEKRCQKGRHRRQRGRGLVPGCILRNGKQRLRRCAGEVPATFASFPA